MWSYPDVEEEAITYQADKLSTATNPDVAESVAISFLLDHYSFPVVLPNSLTLLNNCERPPSSALRKTKSQRSASPNTAPPDASCSFPHMSPDNVPPESPATDANVNKRFGVSPQYFHSINWMNRQMVQDVHWLLGNCIHEELDLTVALELLSMDFPDTMVRRLAVQRLESLSNDDVLRYLLQLVQVCTVITKECRNAALIGSWVYNKQGWSLMSLTGSLFYTCLPPPPAFSY